MGDDHAFAFFSKAAFKRMTGGWGWWTMSIISTWEAEAGGRRARLGLLSEMSQGGVWTRASVLPGFSPPHFQIKVTRERAQRRGLWERPSSSVLQPESSMQLSPPAGEEPSRDLRHSWQLEGNGELGTDCQALGRPCPSGLHQVVSPSPQGFPGCWNPACPWVPVGNPGGDTLVLCLRPVSSTR